MQKVLIIFGTRPEAIKMAPVIKEFRKFPEHFETFACVTGQHRQMLDQVLSIFGIIPDFDMNIMKANQDLYDIFNNVLLKIRDVYKKVKPDLVFVQGDTSTSTAAAFAAFLEKIPVAHIEAGLRTYLRYSPWPEEINRQLTSRLASYHFAPTNRAKENLLKENINEKKIIVTGNTVIDALRMMLKKLNESTELTGNVIDQISNNGYDLSRLSDERKLILITGHRRENFGSGFENICKAIKISSEKFPDFDFLYPVHFNPNVRESVYKMLGNSKDKNVFLIDPLDYLPFIFLMQKCYLLLTDSGGIQEEATDLGKPVLVMRDVTERPEALEAGLTELTGTQTDKIVSAISRLILDETHYSKMTQKQHIYGNGRASEKIVEFFLNKESERNSE